VHRERSGFCSREAALGLLSIAAFFLVGPLAWAQGDPPPAGPSGLGPPAPPWFGDGTVAGSIVATIIFLLWLFAPYIEHIRPRPKTLPSPQAPVEVQVESPCLYDPESVDEMCQGQERLGAVVDTLAGATEKILHQVDELHRWHSPNSAGRQEWKNPDADAIRREIEEVRRVLASCRIQTRGGSGEG